MALNLSIVAGTLPFGTQFQGTPQGDLNQKAQYLSITGGAGFIPVNFGSATPTVDNRDKPWFQTDSGGVPIGWFSWNGTTWEQMPVSVLYGNTASRPTGGAAKLLYFDTDINCLLVYERSAWRTAAGSPGDVKFVKATLLGTALTNNPGWIQDPDSLGRVIGGAGSGAGLTPRAYLDSVGEENHVQTTAELPSHTHPLGSVSPMQADANASNPGGILASYAQGNTGATGDGDAFNVTQPTVFYWVLTKQ